MGIVHSRNNLAEDFLGIVHNRNILAGQPDFFDGERFWKRACRILSAVNDARPDFFDGERFDRSQPQYSGRNRKKNVHRRNILAEGL